MTKKKQDDLVMVELIRQGGMVTRALFQAMMANPIAAVTGTFIIAETLQKVGLFSEDVALTVESLSVGSSAVSIISKIIPKLAAGDLSNFPDTLTIVNNDQLSAIPRRAKK